MKTLNPFNGPGSSLQTERQRKRREQFKIMVWSIVAANALLFTGLLIQGCRQEPVTTESSSGTPAGETAADTNAVAAAPASPEMNSPAAAAPASAPANIPPEATPPAAPVAPQAAAKSYTAVKGDSCYKIAKANSVSLKALVVANPGVDSGKLKVGQVLQIPAAADPSTPAAAASRGPAPAAASPATTPAASAPTRYVVKSGDTLARIARAHRTSVSALKAANGLTNDHIVAGQSLRMPARAAATAKA